MRHLRFAGTMLLAVGWAGCAALLGFEEFEDRVGVDASSPPGDAPQTEISVDAASSSGEVCATLPALPAEEPVSNALTLRFALRWFNVGAQANGEPLPADFGLDLDGVDSRERCHLLAFYR